MSHFSDSVLKQLADQIVMVERPHPVRVAIDGVDGAKIFVAVDFAVSVNRALKRYKQRFGTVEDVVEQYSKRYIPDQKLCLQSCNPQTKADVVIEM